MCSVALFRPLKLHNWPEEVVMVCRPISRCGKVTGTCNLKVQRIIHISLCIQSGDSFRITKESERPGSGAR
jgi:hypothetical protein